MQGFIAYIFAPMISHATVRGSRWLLTAMMVVLLGAQVLQSAHVHNMHGQASDCVQCQADSGQTMAVAHAETPPCLPAADAVDAEIVSATIAGAFRLLARGPPALSS